MNPLKLLDAIGSEIVSLAAIGGLTVVALNNPEVALEHGVWIVAGIAGVGGYRIRAMGGRDPPEG